jgi:hypothetical protein
MIYMPKQKLDMDTKINNMISINLNTTKNTIKLLAALTLTYLLLTLSTQSHLSIPTTYKIATEDSVMENFHP